MGGERDHAPRFVGRRPRRAEMVEKGGGVDRDAGGHEFGGDAAELAHTAPAYSTDVFGSEQKVSEERVKAIIAANEAGRTNVADRDNSPDAVPARLARSELQKPGVAPREHPL